MRRTVLALCAAALLAAPALLGLADGGYRDVPRLVAGVLAWLVVAVAAVLLPRPLPRTVHGRVALGGLAALAALTLASVAWAPLKAPAYADAQRVWLYLGVFVVAVALLPVVGGLRAVEPALAGCAVAIVGYGVSERVLPGLVTLERSVSAGGRLEQPLGYWNAMGAVAAIGLALAVGLAGDRERAVRTRALAVAAGPLLGVGVALSFSRGALLAAALGVAVTLLARPTRPQARAAALVAGLALAAGVLAASLHGVTDLGAPSRTTHGALLGAVLLLAAAVGAAAQVALARREVAGRLPAAARRVAVAAGVAAVLGAGVLVAVGDDGSRAPEFGATASRLSSVQSNRYAYWRVAAGVWADHPFAGAGASGFAVEWLRRRTVAEGARDAHSLPLETAAELGLLGLLALAAFGGGVAGAAWRLARDRPGVAAGAFGALAAWTAHATIDWAWELPADALFGLLLAAAIIAAAPAARAPAPRR
jgi:hypothetical protein